MRVKQEISWKSARLGQIPQLNPREIIQGSTLDSATFVSSAAGFIDFKELGLTCSEIHTEKNHNANNTKPARQFQGLTCRQANSTKEAQIERYHTTQ